MVYTVKYMKNLFMSLLLVLLLVVLLGSGYLLYEEKTFILQSRATNDVISGDNSLAVSTPTCVAPDGLEITRLHVYCLNSQGLGKPNTIVTVSPTDAALDLQIRAIQATTDSTGKATFDITSSTEGLFDLTIFCDDVQVKSNHRVCFKKS